jgi:hypothetical protein
MGDLLAGTLTLALLADLPLAPFPAQPSSPMIRASANTGWRISYQVAPENARAVRLFGTQLLTVRIDLDG